MYTTDEITMGSFALKRITDTLPDGTVCMVLKPENWNEILLLDLDGASNCMLEGPDPDRSQKRLEALFSAGYAYGGIQRMAVGYRFPDAVQMLVDVRSAFVSSFKEPAYTIAYGGSRGAFVGRFCMELRPDIFDGALVYGGGGSGEIAALNSKLDGRFVLNVLLCPEKPLTLANIESLEGEEEKIASAVETALASPLGRARLALAAAYQQLPAWADPEKEQPAADDYEEQFRQIASCFQFAQFTFGSVMIEQLAGGPVSWNTDTDYTDLLERSGRKDFVLAMYEAAGAGKEGLEKDLETLRKAPRIKADPQAVAKAEKLLSYTGQISGPVVNMDNIGDQVDPDSCKYAYKKTLQKRGREDLLKVLWVKSSGHCNFTDGEVLESLDVLVNRIRTGKWEELGFERLNALASGKHPSGAHFFGYEPMEALHEWDYENWDTYR